MSGGCLAHEDETTVTYSVKELLADIRDEMRRMVDVIAGKADKSEVTALHLRVDTTDRRVDALEEHVNHQKLSAQETTQRRVWFWPAVTGTLAALAAVALVLVTVL